MKNRKPDSEILSGFYKPYSESSMALEEGDQTKQDAGWQIPYYILEFANLIN